MSKASEDALYAKLHLWQEQDNAPLMPDVPAQTLFAEWAEEDAKMTDEEREAERRLWESIVQGLAENGGTPHPVPSPNSGRGVARAASGFVWL